MSYIEAYNIAAGETCLLQQQQQQKVENNDGDATSDILISFLIFGNLF